MEKADELLSRLREEIYHDLTRIPAGVTAIGDNSHQDEAPAHEVFVSKYNLGRHLVTTSQYAIFFNALGIENAQDGTYLCMNTINRTSRIKEQNGVYTIQPGFERHPVVLVNWFGAYIFAFAIGGRLPTSTEWEKASRGGLNDSLFPWGNEQPLPTFANFGENVGGTTPVGSYPPNGYDLYDMAGNAWEWTMDWYGPNYKKTEHRDSIGPVDGVDKVIRGGGWAYPAEDMRCSRRARAWTRIGGTNIGFRVVVEPQKQEKISSIEEIRKEFAKFKLGRYLF